MRLEDLQPAMRVTRDVAEDEPNNWLCRDAQKGEIFFRYDGPTYGACDDVNGITLSAGRGVGPYFEFPRDAVEVWS